MASRGRGRRGRQQDASQAPPIFDKQAFAEAVGIAAATISQASTAGSQGGPSNLQRFRAHHPPIFTVTPILKHISFKPFQICGSVFVHYGRPINI